MPPVTPYPSLPLRQGSRAAPPAGPSLEAVQGWVANARPFRDAGAHLPSIDIGPYGHRAGSSLPLERATREDKAGAGGRGGEAPALVSTRISESRSSGRGVFGGPEKGGGQGPTRRFPPGKRPERVPGYAPPRAPEASEKRALRKEVALNRSGPPKYVHACENEAWHLHLEPFDHATGELGMPMRVPFKCHSWRHQGDCRRWIAAQNYSRISKALEPKRPRDVLLMVLTLKPSEWRDRWEAFAELSARWRSLLKAITRTYGTRRPDRIDSKGKAHKRPNVTPDWVATVEIHKSGWPHMNVVLVSPVLADEKQARALAWLKRHAVMCGFGPMASLERARSKGKVANYIVKVAGETDSGAPRATVGEVAKISQLPINAPPHFRRLRSARGFLPPAKKSNASMLGHLERSPLPSSVTSTRHSPPGVRRHCTCPSRHQRRTLALWTPRAAATSEQLTNRVF